MDAWIVKGACFGTGLTWESQMADNPLSQATFLPPESPGVCGFSSFMRSGCIIAYERALRRGNPILKQITRLVPSQCGVSASPTNRHRLSIVGNNNKIIFTEEAIINFNDYV